MDKELAATNQVQVPADEPLRPGTRIEVKDHWIDADVSKTKLRNRLFVRLIAKGKKITNVDFTYSIFDACYFRNCVFDSCDFTGCRFIGSNLSGSSFSGCIFDYATFERTFVDDEILKTGCPGRENLKLKFARTLRTNFQQLGNVRAANEAIKIELEATEVHLREAWKSKELYYREKYPGRQRVRQFFEWVKFKTLDYVWGNGESAFKLGRAVLAVFGLMMIVDVVKFKEPLALTSYWHSVGQVPQIFLGTVSPHYYSSGYLAAITVVRLIALAFFMSIIIKRFNRR